VSNIVEGYRRRRYRSEFLRFLTFPHASSLELQCHLEKLAMIYTDLKDRIMPIHLRVMILSKRIYKFINYVERNWKTKS